MTSPPSELLLLSVAVDVLDEAAELLELVVAVAVLLVVPSVAVVVVVADVVVSSVLETEPD